MKLGDIVSGILSPVASVLTKRTERKMAKESLKAKMEISRQAGETNITLTDAEWEVAMAVQTSTSWKDEYVTLVITYPILSLMMGSQWAAFKDDSRFLEGTVAGINALTSLGMDYGILCTAVVFASMGLKYWRV